MDEVVMYIVFLSVILIGSFFVAKYTKPDIEPEKIKNVNTATYREAKQPKYDTKQWYINNHTGAKRYAVNSRFSWTIVLFGCFVPLFRGDYKWFTIMVCINILSAWFIGCIIMSFLYNDLQRKELINNGYTPL